MSMRLANNVGSLTAQHNLVRSTSAMNKSLERLSSGFKVNRGADGPAALVISEKLRAQIAGLGQAIENTEKATSVVQTAEGALNEINSLLVKIRSLALDSANSGVNDADALAANQAEIANALETINRIANNTQFSTKKLLNGESGVSGTTNDTDVTFLRASATTQADNYSLSVTTAGERATVDAGTAQTAATAADEVLTINGISITIASGSTQNDVISRVNSFTSQTGVTADNNGAGGATRFYSAGFGSNQDITVVSDTAAGATTTGVGTTALTDTGVDMVLDITTSGGTTTSVTGNGNIVEVDAGAAKGLMLRFAAQTGATAHQTVSGGQGNVQVVNNSLVFQIGANQNQTADIAIGKVTADALGLGVSGNQFSSLADINVESASAAQDSLQLIDTSINEITNMRGTLGAFQQNTLESTAANLRATLENSVNAESIIRDTDFASEIANFTKQQVLVQAGTAILGSANQASQLVLSLL